MSMNTSFTRDSHPQLFLPEDPFPYSFEGKANTLRDFLKVVKKNPALVECTHEAFYRLCLRQGLTTDRMDAVQAFTGKEIPGYKAFGKFYGVEQAAHNIIVGYAYSAALGGRARRKALVVTGSPGAGKSDAVNNIQYNVMRSREPAPFLAGSPMWSNPLNALYLARLVASKKTQRRRSKMFDELVNIIEKLDLNGASELNFDRPELITLATKHGFDAGKRLSATDLATICHASDEDFVKLVSYGLGATKASVDALVRPDPWAQDLVLGEFFGSGLIKKPELLEGLKTLKGNAVELGASKSKKDSHYGQFDPEFAVELADFPMDNMFMSEGEGLVDVAEVQPINFDLKVWRGDQDIAAIGLYEDRDPRCVSPSGVFNRGKLIVLTEGLRNPDEGFRVLLEALEGQRLSLPEPLSSYYQQGVGWEGMIVIHSNDEQWNKFYSNPAHRAHNDRFVWESWKYPTEPSQSALVTKKLYNLSAFGQSPANGGVHLEPIVLPYTGMFRVATHLDWATKMNLPFMAVLRAYDGQTLRQPGMGTELDGLALREKAPWTEGLDGMSPRELDTILGELAANARRKFETGQRTAPCVTAAEVRDHIIEKMSKDPRIDKKVKELWGGWLQLPLEKEFRRFELSKVYKAAFIPNYADLCQTFFTKYLDYLKSVNSPGGTSSRPSMSGGTYVNRQNMEAFLQEIERADTLSINSAQADKFRTNVLVAVRIYNEEHGTKTPPYTVHEGLKRCIEAYVLRQAKDITGVVGLTNLKEDEVKRMEGAKARLIAEHGYCDYCAQKLLVEVATTRDFLVA